MRIVATALLLVTMLAVPAGASRLNPADELALLDVGREHKSGYEREDWGEWGLGLDASDDCDTRCEILAEAKRPNGTWYSSYDGFVSANSSLFQLDHLVSVNEAYRSGGWEWSAERRRAFYNDRTTGELRLVSGVSNQVKTNKGPTNHEVRYWMPSISSPTSAVGCTFISDWIHVKRVWELNVDADELGKLRELVAGCGWTRGGSAGRVATFDDLFTARPLHRGHSTVLRLYWAVLSRQPEVEGAEFWLDSYNSGQWSTRRIAAYFAESPEFRSRYGDTLSNQQFVTIVYRNVLAREPEPEGFEFWLAKVNGGMAREEMILLISNAPEFTDAHVLPSDLVPDAGPLG